jgi:hypothetical protein
MADCLIATGKTLTCDTIKKIGGLEGRLWVLNLRDAAGVKLEYTETVPNIIDAITVQPGGSQSYAIDSTQFSHDFTASIKKPGSNKFYGQALNIRAITDDANDLTWSDGMVMATKLVFIVEDLNQRFIILGQNNGMEAQEGDLGGFSQEAESDVTETYPFTGNEKDNKYKFVDVGGYEATLTYLIGLETPTA